MAYIEVNKISITFEDVGGKTEGTFSIIASMEAYVYLHVLGIRTPA